MTTVVKGVKLRLYPNQAQINQLWQLFGNDRFVWNQMLAMANKRYENNPKSHFVGEYDMNYLLKSLKQEYPFLKTSDSTSLLVVNHNLAIAFKNLFQHRVVIRGSSPGIILNRPIPDNRSASWRLSGV